ncbi:MAG: type IV conjugative transfer system protein TraE [Rickettsiales bacterium]|nr:MAG: type IV conjugative transfer system protein TraE [Rickettsiales bacterium]
MLRSIEKENIHKLSKERNIALYVAVSMIVSNMMLAIFVFSNHEKIIIVPASQKESFWVKGEIVSKEYLLEMTDYFASKLLNVSADSIEYNWQIAMKYIDPGFNGELNKRMIEDKKRLISESLSTTFRTQVLEVSEQDGKVRIKGIMTKYVADQKISQDLECYEATYDYHNGILLLTAFEECDEE